MLHGKHLKNGSRTLVLVFQNAAKPLNEAIPKIFKKEINQEQVAQMHEHYTWIKFAERVTEADYLFIKDHFSSVYGWYFINSGQMFYKQFNDELTQFIQKHEYQKVIAFGSSKGGTGALLYGLINPHITDVLSLVPQIQVADFINALCPNEKSLFFSGDEIFEKQVNQLFYSSALYRKKNNCRISFYTGISDIQFTQLIHYRQFLKEQGISTNLYLNRGNEKHTRLVNQYTPYIHGALEDLIRNEQKRTKQQTIYLDSDIYFLKVD